MFGFTKKYEAINEKLEALEKRDLEESIKILKTDISDLKSYISLSLQSMGSI